MSNRTDPIATSIHGSNPQFLIEKITRLRIQENLYWKDQCFGLTAETLVDRAMELTEYGGVYGGNLKPTKFLCLTLKMLQIQPEKEIIAEFIKNDDFPYVRLLGAFYLRLVGKPIDIYQYLEPLYNDYRPVRKKGNSGISIVHIDEFIDELLTDESCCDTALPRLPKRLTLEQAGQLEPRVSALDDDDLEETEDGAKGSDHEGERRKKKRSDHHRGRRSDDENDNDRRRSRDEDRKDRHRSSRSRRSRSRSHSRDRKERRRSRSRDRRDRRDRRSRSRSHSRDRRDRRRDNSRDRADKDRDSRRRRDKDRNEKKSGKDENKNEPTMSAEIEEANKLRASLGLKPLRV
eukprot:TRINITY_DN10914_c0_g1_i1.p1 TRINITY_DN10914_c0_g1~~TRINITY_DN10914_c0_g1_i1.p1  ORF type:complete len:347 (-),score=95.79 TRINITY_DN10914_c0_g1_i1:78-1118(-)